MKMFESVRQVRDFPEIGLRAGMQGAIVEVYSVPTEGYEVEIIDKDGRTIALAAFAPEDLEVVQDPPEAGHE